MKDQYKIGDELYVATNVTTNIVGVTALTLKRWVAVKKMPDPIRISGRLYYNKRLIYEYLAKMVG